MKKLLSLLSVLTISGTAVPTTIAASPYQKQAQETKLENSEINYKQKDNKLSLSYLENNNNFPWLDTISALWKIGIIKSEEVKDYLVEKVEDIKNVLENLIFNNNYSFFSLNLDKNNERKNKICFTTGTLRINYNAIEFFKNLYQILDKKLAENNIVVNALENNSRQRFFVINPDSGGSDYFEIPLSIERQKGFSLVFRARDFYLQGFIIPVERNNTTRQTYYYFDDSEIQFIEGIGSDENLGYNSSYRDLVDSSNQEITWGGIYNSFNELSNFSGNNSEKNKLKKFLAQIILATAESMRFSIVKNLILNTYNNSNILNWEWDFSIIINNWGTISQYAINYYEENYSFTNFVWRGVILILTRSAFIYISPSSSNSKCNKDRISNNEYCFVFPEKIIHWRDDKKSFEIINNWYSNKLDTYIWSKEFDLDSINPKNYNRIEFLVDTSNSRIIWGKKSYYTNDGFDLIEKSDFQNFLKNGNNNGCDQGQLLVGGPIFIVQNLQEKNGKSSINGDQWFAFYYYKNNSSYYLKFSILQRVTSKNNSTNVTLFLYIGIGLRLYNE